MAVISKLFERGKLISLFKLLRKYVEAPPRWSHFHPGPHIYYATCSSTALVARKNSLLATKGGRKLEIDQGDALKLVKLPQKSFLTLSFCYS